MTKLYLTLLLVSAALFMYSCESVTNSVPQDEEIFTLGMTMESSAQTKVDVCHYDAETDAYELINIADPAVDAHIKHGDAQPGDAVPTMEGFEFDDTCTPKSVVVVVEMTACFAEALNDFLTLPLVPVDDLIFEDYEWSIFLDKESFFWIKSEIDSDKTLYLLADGIKNLSDDINDTCQVSIDIGSEGWSSSAVGNFEDDKAYLGTLLNP